jgi:DNA-binding HxlR family transcriptional regulator
MKVGDRWTLQVIDALLDGPRRFGELAEVIAGIAPNILAGRLRQLERDGLIASMAYQRRPVRMVYNLTTTGRELAGAVQLLRAWATSVEGAPGTAHHQVCGTPLEVRLWCPTCAQPAEDGGLSWA